jgi:hypothetical protein
MLVLQMDMGLAVVAAVRVVVHIMLVVVQVVQRA